MLNSKTIYLACLMGGITLISTPVFSDTNPKIYPGSGCISPNDKVLNGAFIDNAIRNITRHALDEGGDQIGYASVNCPITRDSINSPVRSARVTVSPGSDDLFYGTLYCRFIAVSADTSWTFTSNRTVNSPYGGPTGAGLHELTFENIPNHPKASYMVRCDLPPTLPGKSFPAVYSYQANETKPDND